MQALTFRGFLTQYVCQLSGMETVSLFKLAQTCAEGNLRLREPLYLYAAATGRTDVLLRAARGTVLMASYEKMAKSYDFETLLQMLKQDSPELDEDYRKVWRSYQSVLARPVRDNRVKELLRQNILQLHQSTGVTVYRASKDNGLNNGNYAAWLQTGESNKLSLAAARRVYEYLSNV